MRITFSVFLFSLSLSLPAQAALPLCPYFEAVAYHDANTQSAGGLLDKTAQLCAEVENSMAKYPQDEAVQAAGQVVMTSLERLRQTILETNQHIFASLPERGPQIQRIGLNPFALRHMVLHSNVPQAEELWKNSTTHLPPS